MTLPWRATVADWPIAQRERWGRLANALEESGEARFPESEERAFQQVRDEQFDDPTREVINRFFSKA